MVTRTPTSSMGEGPSSTPQPRQRLTGIDVARGVAVLGMFVVHIGVGWQLADGSNALTPWVSGRAAALFALLAGVSIALLSGGSTPKAGTGLTYARRRIALRGLIMLPVGVLLTMTGVSISVILAYYALLFVLVVPVLTWRWQMVAVAAGVLAVIGPVASFLLRRQLEDGAIGTPVWWLSDHDPLYLISDEGIIHFVLIGAYPAVTWMPFVLAGLAIGRLDLRSRRMQRTLTVVGVGVAAVAYFIAWASLHWLGGLNRLRASFDPEHMADYGGARSVTEALRNGMPGTTPINDPAWLLTAAPHSGAPMAVIGSTGVAIAALGLCLLIARPLRLVLRPLADVGALALTVYVGHVLVIWVEEEQWLDGTALQFLTDNVAWTVLIGALACATVWRLRFRRGPLEAGLHVISTRLAGTGRDGRRREHPHEGAREPPPPQKGPRRSERL